MVDVVLEFFHKWLDFPNSNENTEGEKNTRMKVELC